MSKKKIKRKCPAGYRRLLEIDKLISSNTYPSVKTLMKECDASEATINRDLLNLRNDFGAEDILKYDKVKKGFYYTRPSFRLPAMFSSEKQIIAAKLVSNLLNLIKDTPIYKQAIEIFTSLSNNLDDNEKLNAKKLSTRILFLGMTPVKVDDKTWSLLEEAMSSNNYVSFTYRKQSQKFLIAPWQLIYSEGMWTLYGYNPQDEVKDTRFYNLPEIDNLKIDKRTFELPKDFEYTKRAKGNFRRYIGKNTYNFKIKILSEATLNYIKTYKWASDQKFIKQSDGNTIMTFTSNQDYPVLGWVLSHGMYAVPLEPQWLVNEWKKNVRGMYSAARK